MKPVYEPSMAAIWLAMAIDFIGLCGLVYLWKGIGLL